MANPKDSAVYLLSKEPGVYNVHGVPSGEEYTLLRKFKFTQGTINALPLQAQPDPEMKRVTVGDQQRLHWDTELPCFGVRVGGIKTYIVQKTINGKSPQRTIGDCGTWTLDEARKEARRLLVEMDKGIDPADHKRHQKRVAEIKAITLQRAFDDFKKTRALKAGTLRQYDNIVNSVFKDWLDKPVTELTRTLAFERHEKIKKDSGHPYADYALRVLSAILNVASFRHQGIDGRSLIPENPVRVISQTKAWDKARRRETIIFDDQMPSWFKALNDIRYDMENPDAGVCCDYLEFVLFTGLRRNEAATLKWTDVDLDKRTVRVGDTKNGKPHMLPLTHPIVTILERRKKAAAERESPWVFPSPGRKNLDTHLVDPRSVVEMVTKASGVKFTIHDLRRTFASIAGQRLAHYHIKRLMNHAMGGDVTGGYVIIKVDDLREPMQRITDHLVQMKSKGQGMKVAQAS